MSRSTSTAVAAVNAAEDHLRLTLTAVLGGRTDPHDVVRRTAAAAADAVRRFGYTRQYRQGLSMTASHDLVIKMLEKVALEPNDLAEACWVTASEIDPTWGDYAWSLKIRTTARRVLTTKFGKHPSPEQEDSLI